MNIRPIKKCPKCGGEIEARAEVGIGTWMACTVCDARGPLVYADARLAAIAWAREMQIEVKLLNPHEGPVSYHQGPKFSAPFLSGLPLQKVAPAQWERKYSIPLTFIYQVPGMEKPAKQSFDVTYYQLGIVGSPASFPVSPEGNDADDCIPQEPLVLIDLLKGNRYRITIEVENDGE